MSNQLIALLSQWQLHKSQTQWVLGTIFKTQGPCYRKSGAMMLFGGDGQQLGMLSGGCLESDIQKHATKVMATGQSLTISYDGADEDDVAFQLGIGCGGTVHILLQIVNQDNHFQYLDEVLAALQRRDRVSYQLQLPQKGEANTQNQLLVVGVDKTGLFEDDSGKYLQVAIEPQPHLLVVGGGVDARPMVAMAAQLGWTVSLWDPRPANARQVYFALASHILKGEVSELADFCRTQKVNAAVLMSHHIGLDAAALKVLSNHPMLQYLALLGPESRCQQVFAHAGLKVQQLAHLAVSGPAGLRLGGQLPESIALAILAECHAVLCGADGVSISGVLSTPI